MKEIPLTRDKLAIVDDEDYKWLSKYKWCTHFNKGIFYAVRSIKIPKTRRSIVFSMHREILGLIAKDNKIVDHINRNSLDNRKCNLRIVTHSVNMYNSKIHKDNSTGFRGVSWSKAAKKWQVRICKNKKEKYCGIFTDIEEAAKAYDMAAFECWGRDARLNFPIRNQL